MQIPRDAQKVSEIILIFGPRSLSSAVTEVRTENANSRRRFEADGWRAVDGLRRSNWRHTPYYFTQRAVA